jgi:protease I
MKKLVIVIPPKRALEGELLECLATWKGRLNTLILSTYPDHTLGSQDSIITNSLQLENISPAIYDGIVVMGGTGTKDFLFNYAPLIERLQIFDSCRRVVAGIGFGSVVLAQAGLLIGKKATVPDLSELLIEVTNYGGIYSEDDTVTVAWIVTSNGKDAHAFANAVLECL